MTIPYEAVQAAEEAVYKRHERGFLIRPLFDPINMHAALTAALPFLTGGKVKERVFVVSALAQSKDKTGWRSRIIGAANLDEAVGKGLRAFEASEPSVSFCVPGGIEISTETLATAGILSAIDIGNPITAPSPRAQALEDHHDLTTHYNSWRKAMHILEQSSATEEDRLYWKHELNAFDRAIPDAIRALTSQPSKRERLLQLAESAGDTTLGDLSSQLVVDEVDSIEVTPSSGCVFADMGVERPGSDGWFPIETAPKDGTEFLAHDDATKTTHVTYANSNGYFHDPDSHYYSEAPEFKPTHWRPLPASPGASE